MRVLHSTRVLIPSSLLLLVSIALVVNHFVSHGLDTQQTIRSQSLLIENRLATLADAVNLHLELEQSERLEHLVSRFQEADNINAVLLTDPLGNIVASTAGDHIGRHWTELSELADRIHPITANTDVRVNHFEGSNLLTGITQACGFPPLTENPVSGCGIAFMEADLSASFQASRTARRAGLMYSGISTVLAALLILVLLTITVTNRAEEIIQSIERFTEGDRDARIVNQGANELSSVGESVNGMLENIQQTEKSIIDQRTRYKALIDTMADGLITIQRDGTIESLNQAAETLLGFNQRELVGSNVSLIVNDATTEDTEEFLDEFIDDPNKDRNAWHDEVTVRAKSGATFPIRFSVSKMEIEEDTLYIGLLSDISRIKSMEQELRKLNKELSDSNERLEQTVITDSLTGLYNRRHFDTVFAKELQRSTRQNTPISLLVVDIDFFKQFNDRYGHSLGDECLSDVSATIQQVFKRSGDLPARYGGEEFTVVLPGCDGLEAQERAETLRKAVRDLMIAHESSRIDEYVTISIGAVTYKPTTKERIAPKPKELFTAADKALYQAKASGRNRVIFAGHYQPIAILSSPGKYYGYLMGR